MFGRRHSAGDREPLPLSIATVDAFAEAHGISHSDAVNCMIAIGAFVTERLTAGHEFFIDDGASLKQVDWHLPPIQRASNER